MKIGCGTQLHVRTERDKIPQFIVYSNNPLMETRRVLWAETGELMN